MKIRIQEVLASNAYGKSIGTAYVVEEAARKGEDGGRSTFVEHNHEDDNVWVPKQRGMDPEALAVVKEWVGHDKSAKEMEAIKYFLHS